MFLGEGQTKSDVTNSQGTTKSVPGAELPSPPEKESARDHNNFGPFGIVFANDKAMDAITRELKEFPEGSILVREKRSAKDNSKPELLAVMIKRAAGYNPTGGDWQFLLTSGPMTEVKENQKTGECLACHQSQKATDFVYPLIKEP